MARKVAWSESAWDDLEETLDYISKDSPFYAAAFAQEVLDASRTLKDLSERGRVIPEFNRPELRELFIRRYRLMYEINQDTVFIIAFIHGAMDFRDN